MNTEIVLGLDIGGANLKAATNTGIAKSMPFALWQQPDKLGAALAQLFQEFSEFSRLAITMTGELCDCFASSREGVEFITRTVESVFPVEKCHFWSMAGQFVTGTEARLESRKIGAGNWHAVATWLQSQYPTENLFLLDVGSTTSDLIPIAAHTQIPPLSDWQRLHQKKLLYSGVWRTPLCALTDPGILAAEWFATTADLYVLLGEIPEDDTNLATADHRPATIAHAHNRMARMHCADSESFPYSTALAFAKILKEKQIQLLRDGLTAQVMTFRGEPIRWVLAGSGEFLAREAIQSVIAQHDCIVDVSEQYGKHLATALPAYAAALLAVHQVINHE